MLKRVQHDGDRQGSALAIAADSPQRSEDYERKARAAGNAHTFAKIEMLKQVQHDGLPPHQS